MTDMTSNRPYMIRAIYDWLLDNGLTPHLLVDVHYPDVSVPQEYVQDGRIVLNVAPGAVQSFVAGNEVIEFSARFRGVPQHIYIPVHAVLAVYARENGQGMAFDPDDPPEPPPPTKKKPAEAVETQKPNRANLKVVK